MINGANMWDVRENRADVLRLISQMSTNQLTYIRRQVSYGGTLTRERLAELVEDGIVTFDVQMYLAENCSNLSYRLVPSGRVPSHEGGDGGNDGSPDSSDP